MPVIFILVNYICVIANCDYAYIHIPAVLA
jgi:hypothetical protein